MQKETLSEEARELLELLGAGFIPKRTVDEQWGTDTRAAFQELIQAGMVEEISVYRIIPPEESQERKEDAY